MTNSGSTNSATTPHRAGLWHRLYHGETEFDFVGKARLGFILSGTLILIALLSLFTRGLNFGIEFDGGVAWEFPRNGVSVDDTRDALGGFDLDTPKIQTLRSASGDERLRVQSGPEESDTQQAVKERLAELVGVDVGEVSLTSVGPSWGDEISSKAWRALIVFFIVIAAYISLRFEWKMALGALAAVLHDVLISVGVYSVFGFEVTPATVVAFLTILGFSLYDTIVVFDKVHENTRKLIGGGKVTYGDVVNISMNQVLMRSLNTSLAAVLPVLSLLVVGSFLLGAVALEDFALALLVGLITGSYSSIYIATPVLAWLKELEPRYRALTERAGSRVTGTMTAATLAMQTQQRNVPLRPARPSAEGSEERVAARAAAQPGGHLTALGHPPRPRKKKRR